MVEKLQNLVEVPKSALTLRERAEIATIPSQTGKIKYLSEIAGFKPENITIYNNKLGAIDRKDKSKFYPIDPESFELGDIPEAIPTIAQITGSVAGAGMGTSLGPIGTIAGGGAGAALAETGIQKLGRMAIKKRTGKEIPLDIKEIGKQAVYGLGGEVGGLAIKPIARLGGTIVKKGIEKTAELLGGKPVKSMVMGKSIDVAKQISSALGLEDSTIKNIATNKTVNEVISNASPEKLEVAGKVARDVYENTMTKGIDDAQKAAYKGIDNKMPIDISDAVSNIQNKMASYSPITPEGEQAKNIAISIWDKLQTKLSKGKWSLTLGELKELKKQIFDAAEGFTNEATGKLTEAGQLLKGMGMDLVNAQKKYPALRSAADKFRQLMDIKGDMARLARLPAVGEGGEVMKGAAMLESKLASKWKDAGNEWYKETMDNISTRLKNIPESKHLAGFVDKLKATWALKDIAAKRAITPIGAGRIPILKGAMRMLGLEPVKSALILKRGVQTGAIKPERLLAPSLEYPSAFMGRSLTKGRALLESGVPQAALSMLPGASAVKGAAGIIKKPIVQRTSIQTLIRQLRGDNQ